MMKSDFIFPVRRFWLPVLVLALALGTMQGCGGAESKQENTEIASDSTTSLDSLSPEAKVKRLTAQIKLSPKDWELWYDRSLAWYEQGNTAQALYDVDKSIENHFTNPKGYHLRGFYYYVQNQDSAALRDLQRAAQLGSDDPETYYMIGQMFFFRKDYTQALEGYNNALKFDSLSPTYYFARGFLYQTQGKTDKAIAEYKLSLERDPAFLKVLIALHDIYLEEKKDPDQAYAFNDRILEIDSLHPVGRFNQGNFFLARANNLEDESDVVNFQVLVKLAIAEYSKCIQKDPQFILAYYNRGYCYYLLESYSRAMTDFDQVIQRDPFNEKAFFMKANIQEYQGDLVSALANYEQAVKLNPKFSDAVLAVKELKPKVKKEPAAL